MPNAIVADLDRFYVLMAQLASRPLQGRQLKEYSGRLQWPARGVYFFMEPGECRSSHPSVHRIVRVGTHAVSALAKSTLWGRLRAHRGGADGGGNHRGSIFRLHVGAALLAADEEQLATWGVKASAPIEIRATEAAHERRVSAYICSMSVLWVGVPDDPGPRSHRSIIERNSIALLSNHCAPVDPPTSTWLGRHSPREEIVRSGLWNLNHIDERYDPGALDLLEHYVSMTGLGEGV